MRDKDTSALREMFQYSSSLWPSFKPNPIWWLIALDNSWCPYQLVPPMLTRCHQDHCCPTLTQDTASSPRNAQLNQQDLIFLNFFFFKICLSTSLPLCFASYFNWEFSFTSRYPNNSLLEVRTALVIFWSHRKLNIKVDHDAIIKYQSWTAL